MKFAIQGHPIRGKEVIQILESLGGKTTFAGLGFDERYYYYINPNSIIIESSLITIKTKDEFRLYNLEEFEKEFPFKVRDKVTKKNDGKIGTIIKRYNPHMWGEMCTYDILYMVKFNDDPIPHRCSVEELKSYKEMKKERNITLTLDKAKEWYNKGGELKEIALQAFTEEELTKVDLPKTWEEFCKNYPTQAGECWLGSCDQILKNDSKEERTFRNWIPSKKSAEAHLAMIQLEQLRDCWRQGWIPNWLDDNETKYVIIRWKDKSLVKTVSVTHSFLSFPNYILALEFQECFKDLIEKAGDLI